MQGSGGWVEIAQHGDTLVLEAGGRWLLEAAAELDRALRRLDGIAPGTQARLDLGQIEMLDTAGAWLLLRTCRSLAGRGVDARIENVPDAFAPLLDQVAKSEPPAKVPVEPPLTTREAAMAALDFVGERTVDFLLAARDLLGFFGLVCATVVRTLRDPRRLRWTSLAAEIDHTGVRAMPIVGLLSFLIGVVIAFQGADQLSRFGAQIFTANLLALGVLRELGVMMTAVIVAGRSGSAFTAEIGTMQVNEEIDALRTLGLDPVEILVLPRLFGLVIALPLLAFYANFMALLGGALMCWAALGISLGQFIDQVHDTVSQWTFWSGVVKAPFFAAAIALVGCSAGLRVERSAASVGRFTTISVVQSIFLVILLDAAFSVLFAELQI